MKPVSVDEKGGIIFEFENLVQPSRVVGEQEPIRILVPKEKILNFQKDALELKKAGQRAVRSFKRMMASEEYDE